MTTSEIGIINLYNSWHSILAVFATLSLTSGGYMVALKEFEDRRDEYQSSVLTLTSMVSLLFFGMYVVAPDFWCDLLDMDRSLLLLMLVGFLLSPATDFWIARQRYEYKYKLSATITIGSAVLATAASVIVVIHLSDIDSLFTAQGRLFANYSVLYSVAAVLGISIMLKGRKFVSKLYWKFSLTLSIPLMAHSFATLVLSQSDRIMIAKLVNMSAVGIYSTLYTVSSLSTLVWSSLNTSFVPYLYKNIDSDAGKNNIKKITTTLLFAFAVVCVLLTFCAPEIVKILATEEYYEAIYIMPPIAAGMFFIAVSNINSNILLYHKKPIIIALATVIGAVINIVLNAAFIPIFGYMAAAYTTLIGYVIMAHFQYAFSDRIHKKITGNERGVYDNKKIFRLEIATVALCMSGLFLYHYTILRYFAVALLFIPVALLGSRYLRNGISGQGE
jgi:O-antigen/teichoic acid export membrane protein